MPSVLINNKRKRCQFAFSSGLARGSASALMLNLALVFVLLMSTASSYAQPSFARQYKQHYGYTPSCHACHKDGGGTALTTYGNAFKEQGQNKSALDRIAKLDSDGDGIPNGVEASKKSNPSDASSMPSKPGNWLDLSSLIPKEVQGMFPDATAWKPLDAILTKKDLARAQTMGVQLSESDENMIYIPVANRRPIGTALIFPVAYKKDTFFLLMATDRQLNISKVTPLSSQELPYELAESLFSRFAGSPLQSIVHEKGDDLASAVSEAVKRAGTLVYIRLKGA